MKKELNQKKIWEKPSMKRLDFKNTLGGTATSEAEGTARVGTIS